jgi:hypothetical protein
VLAFPNGGFVFLEVDEHQHRFGYTNADGAAISCDAKRMTNVFTSLTVEFAGAGIEPPAIFWLRYNPHEWCVDGIPRRMTKVDRERRLCAFLEEFEPVVGIGYAFYDYDETGLDIVTAEEFPMALLDIVVNLTDLDPRLGMS